MNSRRQFGAIAVFVVCLWQFAPAQWVSIISDTAATYNQVVFVNESKGYIAGSIGSSGTSPRLFVTTDGGITWVVKEVPGSRISAMEDSSIWALSDSVYYSSNNGNSWQPRNAAPGGSFALYFVDTLSGWITAATGTTDMIFHSTNGGRTWSQQYERTWGGDFSYIGRGFFLDKYHGWVVEKYVVLRSSNGGVIWDSEHGVVSDVLRDVFFLDSLRGWTCGFRSVAKTTDGGTNWITTYSEPAGPPKYGQAFFNSIFFIDSLTGWVCDGWGGIRHSTDGGNTWSIQRSDTSGYPPLNSIFFTDKNNGWAVGDGIILHTTNGGGVTAVKEPQSRLNSFALFQNYPNPFNPSTTIGYELSAASYVILKVYDVLGREIATLVDGKETAGHHTVTWNAWRFPGGVYFYRLTSILSQGTFVITKHMMLIK